MIYTFIYLLNSHELKRLLPTVLCCAIWHPSSTSESDQKSIVMIWTNEDSSIWKEKPNHFHVLDIFVWIKVLLHISPASLYYLAVFSNISASIACVKTYCWYSCYFANYIFRVYSKEEKLGIQPWIWPKRLLFTCFQERTQNYFTYLPRDKHNKTLICS